MSYLRDVWGMLAGLLLVILGSWVFIQWAHGWSFWMIPLAIVLWAGGIVLVVWWYDRARTS